VWETRECYLQFRINIGCPARVLLLDNKISKFFTKYHPKPVDEIFGLLGGKVLDTPIHCLPVYMFSAYEGNFVDKVA
jgi:hypothetical protein